jgi:hypothetical protein
VWTSLAPVTPKSSLYYTLYHDFSFLYIYKYSPHTDENIKKWKLCDI